MTCVRAIACATLLAVGVLAGACGEAGLSADRKDSLAAAWSGDAEELETPSTTNVGLAAGIEPGYLNSDEAEAVVHAGAADKIGELANELREHSGLDPLAREAQLDSIAADGAWRLANSRGEVGPDSPADSASLDWSTVSASSGSGDNVNTVFGDMSSGDADRDMFVDPSLSAYGAAVVRDGDSVIWVVLVMAG